MDLNLPPTWLVASLIAAPILTTGLIRLLSRPVSRIGLVDEPDARKRHGRSVALAGGPAMFAAFALVLLASGAWSAAYSGLLAAMAIVAVAGIADDLLDLRAAPRLAIQVVAAVTLIAVHDMTVAHLGGIAGEGRVTLGGWQGPFTVLCVVGVINAINMIDGLDGLAGGVTTVMLAGLIAAGLLAGTPAVAVGPVLLVAVIAGFLVHNFPRLKGNRERVFMGDAGSMMLGMAIAWFGIDLTFERGGVPPIVTCWILALPVIDTVAVMTRRVLRGRNPMHADREHLHHVLLGAGLSPAATVHTMMAVAAITATVGLAGWRLGVPQAWLFAGFIALLGANLLVTWLAGRAATARTGPEPATSPHAPHDAVSTATRSDNEEPERREDAA